MIKYEVIIYWSNEDQAFIAEVPELPGCAADEATYQEALSNLEVVIQEWIDFRCQDLAEYYGKLGDYIRRLNPNVVVELNPHGIYGTNRAFLNGVDHARLLPHGSVFWSEEPNEAQVNERGILVSKIRSFKLARSLDQTLFIYTGAQRADPVRRSYRLLMAEAMAFNRNCLGDIGQPLTAYEIPDDMRRYIRFYLENNRHYSATRTVADVAALRCHFSAGRALR